MTNSGQGGDEQGRPAAAKEDVYEQTAALHDHTVELTQRVNPEDAPQALVDSRRDQGNEKTLEEQDQRSTDELRAEAGPQRLGRYEVQKVLGEGAFGVVYQGFDEQLKRSVAIKVPQVGASRSTVDEFLREAQQLAQLKHPGIVSVFDVGVEDGRCYIVSDYLRGPNLSKWTRENEPDWQRSVRIVAAMCDALAHAHAKRIVHRDLKPGNVIMTEDMGPVVVDFGLALNDERAHTDRGQIVGTPNYMSPEQARGEGHRIDGRTDIYALGVVLYWMLTSQVPFRAPSAKELLRQICNDEPQPPRQLVRHLPAELEDVCLKAMAKRLNARYTTADDMATALRQLIGETGSVSGVAGASSASAPPVSTPAPIAERPAPTDDSRSGSSASRSRGSSIRRAREAERRQVTLLSAASDVFDSEEVQESLDYDEQNELLLEFQDVARTAVAQLEGTVIQTTDQGLVASFGFPQAFEDSAPRGIRAALALLSAMAALNERLKKTYGVSINASLVVHTGVAIVEDKGGEEAGENVSIVGQVRNVARNLEAFAEPNAVVISDDTRRLAQGLFEFESLGAQRVRGISRGVEIHRVSGERTQVGSRVDAADPNALTPLIGRDREVGLLEERWEQAVEGMGQVVLLIGEAGLGKSRLVHTLREHVVEQSQEDDEPVLEWRCTPQHQASSLYPAIKCIERAIDFGRDDSDEQKRETLAQYLSELNLDGEEEIGLFSSLLSIPLPANDPVQSLAPQKKKEKTLQLVLDWLRECSYIQPILFIVEDLHWIDPTSLELLELLVEEGERDSLLTLLTFRPEFETPWKSKAHQTQVALTRLTKRQIAEMMTLKSGITSIPQHVVDQVIERTDGVPLFVEEFTQMVVEAGAVREVDGESEISGSFPIHEIPATLQDLLMSRLDRMASDLDVVQLGAVIGREFTWELIAKASPLDEDALRAELSKLVESGLLSERGRAHRARYEFKHALLLDAAYQSLVKKKRQQFHKLVADVMAGGFRNMAETEPEVLAYHFTEANEHDTAIEYWTRAGQRAITRSANLEALEHLDNGLKLIEKLDESRNRDQLELKLQTTYAVPLSAVRGYVLLEVESAYQRARELSELLDDTESLFTALHGLYRTNVVRGDLDDALTIGAELLTRAVERDDDEAILEAHRALALTTSFQGRFVATRRHATSSLALYDREAHREHAFTYGADPGVLCHSFAAWAAWHLGEPDTALREGEAAMELADTVAHAHSRAFAGGFGLATTLVYRRDWDEAAKRADATLALAKEESFPYWLVWSTCLRGAIAAQRGEVKDGIAELKQGLEMFSKANVAMGRPFLLSLLADAYRLAGKPHRGLEAIEEATELLRPSGDLYAAELARLRGELLLDEQDDRAAADGAFHDAIEIAQAANAKSLELRALMSLVRLYDGKPEARQHRESLATLVESFEEGAETVDHRDAKQLL